MPMSMTASPSIRSVFDRVTLKYTTSLRTALDAAAKRTADDIEAAGRQDLQSAGNFGGWAGGFKATVGTGIAETEIKVTIDIDGSAQWWYVHQKGMTIYPREMKALAIPIKGAVPKGVWPRDYGSPLYAAKGVLFSAQDHSAKYILKSSVTIPKRLHLVEVSEEAAKKFGEYLHAEMPKD